MEDFKLPTIANEESSQQSMKSDDITRRSLSLRQTMLDDKIKVMRARFLQMQVLEQLNASRADDDFISPPVVSPNNQTLLAPLSSQANALSTSAATASTHGELNANATQRWGILRKVLRPTSGRPATKETEISRASSTDISPKAASVDDVETTPLMSSNALDLEDIQLQALWKDRTFFSEFEPLPGPFAAVEKCVPEQETTLEKRLQETFEESKQLQIDISQIPAEVVQNRKEEVEKMLFEEQKRALDHLKALQTDVIWRENIARIRVQNMEADVKSRQYKEKEKILQLAFEKEAAIAREFRRAREELEAGIKRQHGAIREHFGALLIHNESLSRRFHVYTRMFPQPVEFRIHLLRAVKNKLPKGQYCIMLTQYENLGGYPLTWSHLGANGIGAVRPGLTRIVKHAGRFFDRTLRFEDSCFALCPPRPLIKPGFAFVLELFQLASYKNPEDKIVGWTAMPMAFENTSIVDGKFKLPLLAGEHTAGFQHFKSMEKVIAKDLDEWLCNVYFEVRHISLSELGATEAMLKSSNFDLDYFNKTVIPDSKINDAWNNNNEHAEPQHNNNVIPMEEGLEENEIIPIPIDKGIFHRKSRSSRSNIDPANGPSFSSPLYQVVPGTTNHTEGTNNIVQGDEKKDGKSPKSTLFSQWFGPKPPEPCSVNHISSFQASVPLTNDDSFVDHRKKLLQQWKSQTASGFPLSPSYVVRTNEDNGEVRERGYNIPNEFVLHRQQRGKLMGIEAIDDEEGRRWANAALDGRIVRRWQSEGPRFDSDAIAEIGPDSSIVAPTPLDSAVKIKRTKKFFFDDWVELRDPRDMAEYSMSLTADPSHRKNSIPGAIARSKLRYLYLELFGDLVPFLFGTFEFYMTILLYLFSFWIRIYMHYLAEYLYLLSQKTPVYNVELHPLFIQMKYMSSSLSTPVEVGVVAIGPLANIVIFLFLVAASILFYRFTGYLPDVCSKFFAYYGVATVLDPFLTLLIDLIYHHFNCASVEDACRSNYTGKECNCFNGDFVKLFYRMDRLEGSGLTGIVITAMIYLGTGVLASLVVYEYLLHVHRDGRILDLWRRTNAPAEEFFIPDDYEVSMTELRAVMANAKTWRGFNNARRKAMVTEEVLKDEVSGLVLRQKKYMIHEIDSEGKSVIHRQFILDEEGKILELFFDPHQVSQHKRAFNMGGEEANPEDEDKIVDDHDNEHVHPVNDDHDNDDENKTDYELQPTRSNNHVQFSDANNDRQDDRNKAGLSPSSNHQAVQWLPLKKLSLSRGNSHVDAADTTPQPFLHTTGDSPAPQQPTTFQLDVLSPSLSTLPSPAQALLSKTPLFSHEDGGFHQIYPSHARNNQHNQSFGIRPDGAMVISSIEAKTDSRPNTQRSQTSDKQPNFPPPQLLSQASRLSTTLT